MDNNNINDIGSIEEKYNIVGESPQIKEALEVAKKIASTDAAVIIYGESGTGKELFVRFIQLNSKRKDKKFIAINCAAIPSELLENELFGHKKGAFTDANEDYIGKFGFADGGTIFLDEVSELGLNLQAKLLRILQFKEYEPVGGVDTLKSDVRIITATNKDLQELIKEKKFREDLYYRLNVIPITIPPLRKRLEDIELLANYFLKMYNLKNKNDIKGITSNAIKLLRSYDWPGNVRELQNVIERAVVLCGCDYIDVENIVIQNETAHVSGEDFDLTLKNAVNNFKREYIVEALERNGWNQTKTAKELDIQRTYLSRLIKELNIDIF